MKINYDYFGRNEPSRVYLARPDKTILCALNSIDVDSVNFSGKANDISTFSFDMNQYVENDKELRLIANGYYIISRLMKLYVTNIGWFIIDTVASHNSGTTESLSITAQSAQREYNQIPLDTWKVNRGTTDSLEMLVEGNVTEEGGVEFAKENIKFYNKENPELSLVHILVKKVSGWKVGYIDPLPKIYETYGDVANIENMMLTSAAGSKVAFYNEGTKYEFKKVGTSSYSYYNADSGKLLSKNEIENLRTLKNILLFKSVYLPDEVGAFDVDYDDCYSFMIQDFEKYFNCIVDFDYLNFEVNFYRVENFGENTNVTIGFRNVENTNDVSVDDDNIFTKFRVAGGEGLGIEQFNGGSNYLISLPEYWLNHKYFSQSTIDKYKKWERFCGLARYEYGDLSRRWNSLQDEITEIYDRMPISDCDPDNWSKLEDSELLTFQSEYEAQKKGYESIYVDDEGNFDSSKLEASDDAQRYHQIVDVILPNIQIEIDNRELPTSEGESDFIEDYETKWEYYGVNELSVKLESYKDIVNLLKKSHYDLTWERYQELSKENIEEYPARTEDGFADKHAEYVKNATQLDETNIDKPESNYISCFQKADG